MLIDDFLSDLKGTSNLSPRSLRAYDNDLRQFEHWLAGRAKGDLGFATVEDVQEYLRWLTTQGRKPSSTRRSASAIARLFKFLGRPIPRGSTQCPTVADPTSAFGRALTHEQLDAMRTAARGPRPADSRNTAIVEMLYGLGLRVSELVALDVKDMSLELQMAIVIGKGGVRRVVPLGGDAMSYLGRWLSVDREKFTSERGVSSADSAVFINRGGGRI